MRNILRILWIITGVLWSHGMMGQTPNEIIYELNGNKKKNYYAIITGNANYQNSTFTIESNVNYNKKTYPIIGINSIGSSDKITTVQIGPNIGNTVNAYTGTIAPTAFDGCPNLASFEINGTNSHYSAVDGVLFNADKTELLFYPIAKNVTTYEIPVSVSSIASSAKLNRNITSLVFKGTEKTPNINHTDFLDKVDKANCILKVTYTLYDNFKNNVNWNVIKHIVGIQEVDGQTQIKFSEAGNLSKYLSSEQTTLKNLKINGPLNGTDIAFLRKLTSGTGNLATLDLTDATIVKGGNGTDYTNNNIFPEYAFLNCSKLTSISLPTSVTKIESGAFEGASKLEKAIMSGDSLTTIEANAFFQAENITQFNIPASVTKISPYAFTETWGNTRFSINNEIYQSDENGVVYTGNTLFLYPSGSTNPSITIPKNITNINTESGLTLAQKLEKIIVDEENKHFSTNNSILYNKDFSTLLIYPLARKETEYEIPASVTKVEHYVVLSKNVTSLTYKGNQILQIDEDNFFSKINTTAFTLYVAREMVDTFKNTFPWNSLANIYPYDMTEEEFATKIEVTAGGQLSGKVDLNATHLIITGKLNGADIKTLRDMALNYQLQYLNLKEAFIITGGDAYNDVYYTENNVFPQSSFTDCSKLQTIVLPVSVNSIGEAAFKNCVNLTTVNMTDCKFTTIGKEAFRGSAKIKGFALPNTLKATYEKTAFIGTSANREFSIQGVAKELEVMEGVLFSANKKVLLAFPGGKIVKEYTVPMGVDSIGSCSFSECTNIETLNMPYGLHDIASWAFERTKFTTMRLPATVTNIRRGVFNECSSLRNLYLGSKTPPSIETGNQTFDFANCILYVPKNTNGVYETHSFWKQFKNIQEVNEDVSTGTAGKLEELLPDSIAKELSSIVISGEINSKDIQYLRNLAGVDKEGSKSEFSNLKSLDLGQATIVPGGDPYLTVDNKTYSCENNRMGEYAFANTNLEKFRFPAGIVTVDSTIFKGSENLNSIQFDKLPAGMTTQAAKNLFGENQKNGIIAINSTGTASNVTNVVFLNDAESEVVLVDKYNYDSDVKLSVGKCTFTKEFSKETKKGEPKGWETIMLPFIPTEIRGKNLRGNEAFLVPFGSDKNAFTGKGLDLVLNFWMKKLNPDGEFVNITFDEIEANVPYLISMPNNTTDYGNTYNISGDVQFIANAAAGETVALNEKADPGILTGKYYDFSATFKAFTDASVYVLNAAGSSFDLITGEEFKERANKVNAFEGYAVAHIQYQGVKSFRFDEAPSIPSDIEEIMMNRDDEKDFFIRSTSNGMRIVSNVNKAIQIYSIEGRLIANEYIYEGENFVALPKGIYLIERQKVVVY